LFKRKKEIFKFTGRSHSVKGLISLAIGIISLLTFIIISILSSFSKGNGGLILGIIGLVLFVVSVTGFILGIKACKEKEIYYKAPITGMVINGLLSLLFLILYMVGVIL
jgi:hypothetical protein